MTKVGKQNKPIPSPPSLSPEDQLRQLIDDYHEVTRVWHTWRALFWPKPGKRRYRLGVANDFMGTVSVTMQAYVITGLVRLNDQAESGRKANLVVKRVLRDYAVSVTDPTAAPALAAATDIDKACDELAAKHRHAYYAHNDFEAAATRFKQGSNPAGPMGLVAWTIERFTFLLAELERLKLPGRTTYFDHTELLANSAVERLMSSISETQPAGPP